jgi:hypothetical protein
MLSELLEKLKNARTDKALGELGMDRMTANILTKEDLQ